MSFYNKMQQTMDNVSVTENGMVGYKTTYHPLVDMNFRISSYRNMSESKIAEDFVAILKDTNDSKYALRFLFMVRDAREGLGERRLFRVCINELIKHMNDDNIVKSIIDEYIPEYGRYDDLLVFMDTKHEDYLIESLKKQLLDDFTGMQNGTPISLLAKWMPSINGNRNARKLALKIAKKFGSSEKEYRQLMSSLRAYLDIVEVKTSDNKWGDINYNTVPSRANLKYKNAFLKHDEERRREYLAKLVVGDKSVKINSSVNFPHDIVSKYMGNGWSRRVQAYDETLEQLWKNLPQMEGMNNTIVVRDGSGSMYQTIQSGSNVQAIDVASALTVYCAERLQGDFKNKFITFSSRPQMVDLTELSSLHSKLDYLADYDDCSNTNLESVFDLILKTAKDHNMKQEEIPSQIMIVSDMEFDGATTNRDTGNVIEAAAEKFASAGYELPKLVFWNVCSRTTTIPCKYNKNGVLLVSGFSVNVVKMVINGETDPYEALIKELNSDRYNKIPEIKIVYNNVKKNTSRAKLTNKPSWL